MNIHQLLHLPNHVRELGPLYTHSCFSFEDKNGFILKQTHGTQYIDSQIMYAVSLTQKIPELRQTCIFPESEEEKLFLQLSYTQKPKRGLQIVPGIYILGTPSRKILDNDEFRALERYLGYAPASIEVTIFNRLELNSSYIYGTSYKRMSRRNCATIKYILNGSVCFGQVKFFIQYKEAGFRKQTHHIALLHPLRCDRYNPSSHINVVTLNQNPVTEFVAVNIDAICENCIYISFPEETVRAYVCEFPNKLEME